MKRTERKRTSLGGGVLHLTFPVLLDLYSETQKAEPCQTAATMKTIEGHREVSGWFLVECEMLGGSRMGERTLIPYGPGCTFKEPPKGPISPRGLASDMAVVKVVVEGRISDR